MAPEWYYAQQGQQRGPVDGGQLKKLAAAGTLAPTDLVWREGMADWKPASEIKGLLFPAQPSQTAATPTGVPEFKPSAAGGSTGIVVDTESSAHAASSPGSHSTSRSRHQRRPTATPPIWGMAAGSGAVLMMVAMFLPWWGISLKFPKSMVGFLENTRDLAADAMSMRDRAGQPGAMEAAEEFMKESEKLQAEAKEFQEEMSDFEKKMRKINKKYDDWYEDSGVEEKLEDEAEDFGKAMSGGMMGGMMMGGPRMGDPAKAVGMIDDMIDVVKKGISVSLYGWDTTTGILGLIFGVIILMLVLLPVFVSEIRSFAWICGGLNFGLALPIAILGIVWLATAPGQDASPIMKQGVSIGPILVLLGSVAALGGGVGEFVTGLTAMTNKGARRRRRY
jgi:hypothetical protein